MDRIGIDFDNTLVCYSEAIHWYGRTYFSREFKNVRDAKTYFNSLGTYQVEWQKVQEWLYTEGLKLAIPNPGFNVLRQASQVLGFEVFIVSHKSQVTKRNKIELRTPAFSWLTKVFPSLDWEVGKNVFFEDTRKDKVDRINSLKLSHYIDDLIEVFQEPDFPKEIRSFYLSGEAVPLELPGFVKPIRNFMEIFNG